MLLQQQIQAIQLHISGMKILKQAIQVVLLSVERLRQVSTYRQILQQEVTTITVCLAFQEQVMLPLM